MKALELTVYPPIPECPQQSGWGYARDDWFDDRAKERNLTEQKRLTDAELAAEYWSEEKNLGDVRDWIKTLPGYQVLEPVLLDRVLTLHRFATLPHYDEAPSPSPAGPETKGTQQ